jgi:hypothetical protein
MRPGKRLIGCAIFSLLSSVGVAHAQSMRAPDKRESPNENLVFDDDLLAGDLATPFGNLVFAGHIRPAHVMLIRPRTSFVPELYKSVEHI